MKLRGYRSGDGGLLTGRWLPDELLAAPRPDWPVLAEPVTIPAPAGRLDELLAVVDAVAFVRFCSVDWVARRARLQIGLQEEAGEAALAVLELAVEHATGILGLRRLYGWVTLAQHAPTELLAKAGFAYEATIPRALWHGGAVLAREIWGRLADDGDATGGAA